MTSHERGPLGALAAERLAVAACRLAAEVAGWEGDGNRAAGERVLAAVASGELPRLGSLA